MTTLDYSESRIKDVEILDCELTEFFQFLRIIQKVQPDEIYNLAAQSFVPRSWKAPTETVQINVIGTINIFEAVRKFCPNCIIQVAGSSEEYGMVYPNEVPIKETNLLIGG